MFLTGSDQNRPSDFISELRNMKFKDALVKFMMDHWSSDQAAEAIGQKEIYISYDKCYKYTAANNSTVTLMQNMINFKCEGHEVADTKLVFFLSQFYTCTKVVIRCADTDILVIALGNMEKFNPSLEVT